MINENQYDSNTKNSAFSTSMISNDPSGTRKKTLSKRKWFIYCFLIILVAILSLGIYLGKAWYKKYKSRFLIEAEARLNIDDRTGAIESLRAHILANPKDFQTQLRLAQLLSETGELESARRLYDRIIRNASISKINQSVLARAALSLGVLIRKQSDEIAASALEAMEQEDFKKAISLYEEAIKLLREHPIVFQRNLYSALEDTSHIAGEYYLNYNLTLSSLAYVYWRSGDLSGVEMTIDKIADILVGIPEENTRESMRRWLLSDKIAEWADQKLAENKWTEATDGYRAAKEQLLLALEGKYNEHVGRLQYNEAIAEYNAKHYSKARQIAKDLSENLPDYEQDGVKELISGSREAGVMVGCEDMMKQASKAFDDENWALAAKKYLAITDYFLSQGYSESNELVAWSRFNTAIAYYNDNRYKEAEKILLVLKRGAPNYDSLKIQELLSRCRQNKKTVECYEISMEASKAFQDNNWTVALSKYKEAARCLINSGIPKSDDVVSESLYNAAMAYYNDNQYKQAKLLLEQIRRDDPDYESILVEEQIRKVKRMIDLFGE